MTIPRPKRDSYLVRRAVKKQIHKLGLDRAERIIVETCGNCPCCKVFSQEEGGGPPECSIGAQPTDNGTDPPPHNCPLRTRALSIAIDPAV